MGEAARRRRNDPTYGIVPKDAVEAPLWLEYKGVLFLVGEGNTLACLPAGNKVVPNAKQRAVMDGVLASNPYLLEGVVLTGEPTSTDPTGSSIESDTNPLQE